MWQIRGELSAGDGPPGRRGERTPDHKMLRRKERKKEKGKKMRDVWVEAGSGAQTEHVGII